MLLEQLKNLEEFELLKSLNAKQIEHLKQYQNLYDIVANCTDAEDFYIFENDEYFADTLSDSDRAIIEEQSLRYGVYVPGEPLIQIDDSGFFRTFPSWDAYEKWLEYFANEIVTAALTNAKLI